MRDMFQTEPLHYAGLHHKICGEQTPLHLQPLTQATSPDTAKLDNKSCRRVKRKDGERERERERESEGGKERGLH